MTQTRSQKDARNLLAVLLAVAVLAGIILFRYPPALYPFYPRCPVETLLHLRCPGCGTTRALAALLHGHVAEALHWNALTTCLLPLAVIDTSIAFLRALRGAPVWHPATPAALRYVAFAVVLLFTISRNL